MWLGLVSWIFKKFNIDLKLSNRHSRVYPTCNLRTKKGRHVAVRRRFCEEASHWRLAERSALQSVFYYLWSRLPPVSTSLYVRMHLYQSRLAVIFVCGDAFPSRVFVHFK